MSIDAFPVMPIGYISTPFRQKFAIPRQPNLARAKGVVKLLADFDHPDVFKGIEGFSHLWLLFHFHETAARGWKPAVKAPRLGGNATLGVFASRSTHRPNSIGMSVVENGGVVEQNGHLALAVFGVDLVDQTPILDIKPYLPYADSVKDATDPLASYSAIPERPVSVLAAAEKKLAIIAQTHSDFYTIMCSILKQDPRPAYRQQQIDDDKIYKVALYNWDISWQVRRGIVEVLDIHALEEQ